MIDEAIEALLAYQQADMEGVMVLTSRQAIHEVADELSRLRDVAQSSQVRKDALAVATYIEELTAPRMIDLLLDRNDREIVIAALKSYAAQQPAALPQSSAGSAVKSSEATSTAVKSSKESSSGSEPVAWRWKVSPMQLNWQYSDAPPATFPVYNLELLYRDPPQTSGVWQPIETAPQDGSQILATGGGLAKTVEIVSYNERVGAWDAMTCTLDDIDDEPQGYSRPTHWQPLPSSTLSRPLSNCGGGAK